MAGISRSYRRLGQVSSELNRSIHAIVQFLRSKGYDIDDSPHEKIKNDVYEVLVHEFMDDIVDKAKNLQKRGMERSIPPHKVIHLSEGDVNFSYKSLFGKYLVGCTLVQIIDPYIRSDIQITNLIELIKTIVSCSIWTPQINLITGSKNLAEKAKTEIILEDLAKHFKKEKLCFFTYSFDKKIHDRSIEIDKRWLIVLGRGLDFFEGVVASPAKNNYRKLKVRSTIITVIDKKKTPISTSKTYKMPA